MQEWKEVHLLIRIAQGYVKQTWSHSIFTHEMLVGSALVKITMAIS